MALPFAAIALALVLAACSGESADPCTRESVTLTATVTVDAVEPGTLEACRGQEVTMELAAQTDGVFHIHGYDDVAIVLHSGETTSVTFAADVAGQFIIELHSAGVDEKEIGVFTVNEP
jgi:hypothetical protein